MRRRLFNKQMTVTAVNTAADGIGGWRETPVPVGGIIPCRCRAINGQERQIYRQEGVDITHRLQCPADHNDRAVNLTNVKTIRIDNTEYDVQFVRQRGTRTKHVEADLVELRHEPS